MAAVLNDLGVEGTGISQQKFLLHPEPSNVTYKQCKRTLSSTFGKLKTCLGP